LNQFGDQAVLKMLSDLQVRSRTKPGYSSAICHIGL